VQNGGTSDQLKGHRCYDALNRLTSSKNTAVTGASTHYANFWGCWSYDSFGNRLSESISSTACGSTPPMTSWANYNASNRMVSTNQNSAQASGYDAAGDVTYDGVNQYLYDGEGRICAVASTPIPGLTTLTGYLYDAGGTRVAKGSIATWSCDPTVNGFQTTKDYILGASGEQMTEMGMDANNTMAWQAGGAGLRAFPSQKGGCPRSLAGDPGVAQNLPSPGLLLKSAAGFTSEVRTAESRSP
jgi:hypothetical protein